MLLLIALTLVGPVVSAKITASKLFGDGMVLQRDEPVRVWGWAVPGELVSVRFAGQSVGAEAGADGKWVAVFEPMQASFEPRTLEIAAKSGGLSFSDVLVGEVWLCGGQSNMAWSVGGSLDPDMEIASADTPAIRYLRLKLVASHERQADVPLDEGKGWRPCTPEHVRDCTGVGYHFARRLQRYLKVPVGIIDNSWGGTTANHWCSPATLSAIPEMKPAIDQFGTAVKAWVDGGGEAGAKARLEQALKDWELAKATAEKEGKRAPGRPRIQVDPRLGRQPSGMYNTLLAPMAGLSLRGVLFYQGENNSFGEAWKPFYATYPGLIQDWRAVLDDDELPFGLIQIAGWSNRRSMTYDQNHHTNVVREIQFKTWQGTPNTGLIVTYDTNSDGNIHPKNKRPIGERSARWALSTVYGARDGRGNPLEWRGPTYLSYKIEGNKVVVQFDKATANGLRLDKDDVLGFYIAGEDRVWHHAESAAVDRGAGTVSVWSAKVPEPEAVRYAISNLPVGSLMNGREIPAYPFRTDTWPITPHQSKGSYVADKNPPVVED
ncbi:MAG: sialate O-acetylesterase [Planctomycetota bacterium]